MCVAGDPGALEPLNDDLRDEDRSTLGGGNILDGVLGTDGVGVSRACCEDDATDSSRRGSAATLTDSASLAVDSRLNRLGRLGVRLWLWLRRCIILVFLPIAWISRTPCLYEML